MKIIIINNVDSNQRARNWEMASNVAWQLALCLGYMLLRWRLLWSFALEVDLNQKLNKQPLIDRTVKKLLTEQSRSDWPCDWQIITVRHCPNSHNIRLIRPLKPTFWRCKGVFPKSWVDGNSEWPNGRQTQLTVRMRVYTWPPCDAWPLRVAERSTRQTVDRTIECIQVVCILHGCRKAFMVCRKANPAKIYKNTSVLAHFQEFKCRKISQLVSWSVNESGNQLVS